MTKHEQVANILSFFLILFCEKKELPSIMEMSPDYIIEKFDRYILSSRAEYQWGMHPVLRKQIFHKYVDKWELELNDE